MAQDKPPRRFKKTLLVFGLLSLGAVVFHRPLVLYGCKAALARAVPAASYGTMQWENGAIAISGLTIKEEGLECSVDRIELKLSGSVFPFRIAPQIAIVHPQILLSKVGSGQTPVVPLFYRTRLVQPQWTIHNGVLELPTFSRLYFSMDPLLEEEGIGSVRLSHDPSSDVSPMLSAEMRMGETGLQVGFQLQEKDFSRLHTLTSLLWPSWRALWETAQGEVQLEGLIGFGKGWKIEELHVHGDGERIALQGSHANIQCDIVEASFSVPAHGELSASLKVMEGECFLNQSALGLKNLNGQIAIGSQEESEYLLSGMLIQDQAILPFTMTGNGGLQEDETLWSELAVMLKAPKGAEMHSLVSLCSHEKGALAMRLKIEDATSEHIEFLRTFCGVSGECVEGSVAAEATVLVQKGKCESITVEKCTLKNMHWFFPEEELLLFVSEGSLTEPLELCKERLIAKMAGEEVHFSQPRGVLDLPTVQAQLFYEPSAKKWNVELPLEAAQLSALSDIGGHIQIAGEGADWKIHADLKNLTIPVNGFTSIKDGRCTATFDSKLFNVEKAEGVWELMDGTPLTVQVKRLTYEQGSFDFALSVVDGKKEFIQCAGKAIPSADSLWEVALNAEDTHFGGTQLNVNRCRFNSATEILSLEMKPTLKCQSLHSQVSLLQNAGFLNSDISPQQIQELQLEGTVATELSSENIKEGFTFRAESEDLKVKGESLPPFYVSGQKKGEKWQVERLTAGKLSLKGDFLSDARGFTVPHFEGSWDAIAMKGSGYALLDQKRVYCTLESVKGSVLTGAFVAGAGLMADFSGEELQIEGEANAFMDLTAPLPLTINNKKAVKFAYNTSKGFSCRGIDLQLRHKTSRADLGDFMVESATYIPGADLALQKTQFSLAPALFAKLLPAGVEWEGNLEGNADVKVTEGQLSLQGNLKAGSYGFKGKKLPFEQLQLRYEKEILSLRAKAHIEQQPLWAAFQVDLAKKPYGMLKLHDHPKSEGLKLLFSTEREKIVVDSLQGSCYGLNCSLSKSASRKLPAATVLTGEVKLDGNALSAILPKIEKLKVGNGYQWKGELILWDDANKQFSLAGTLTGKEFEALGYRLGKLEGVIEATPTQVTLTNVKIDDESGSALVKKLELKKEDNDWALSIPQILVRQLAPSLMRKIDSETLEVKPFLIKNFTLEEIRGKLGDLSSLEGSGHLMFVNQFKKESSIFDVPVDILKKIGLDLGLLTPVQGEVQMELRGDKFYLISLDNAFSAGERSEFYLPMQKELSYIDLDGKVHIDLKMRQDVLLKLTEPFTLTIRGTLDKPRYGLQF